jgi:hypothetical protein
MTIYIPLLYICFGVQCGFFQSETYTLSEQDCLQEVQGKKAEYPTAKIEGTCVDIKLDRKKDEPDSKLLSARDVQI